MIPVRLGLLRLADSLPVLVAERRGLYRRAGLDVQLHVEPSWSNIADKLAFGGLDAAVMLPSLALAVAAGLRGPPTPFLVPMVLSTGGNGIVLGDEAASATGPADVPAQAARRFARWLKEQPEPPRLAVVHAFSTHALLLRDWLASGGVDPDRDVELVAIPPAEVVAALASRKIAGFCAGPPWGDEAAMRGAGRLVLGTGQIRPGHMEKCLAVRRDWAREQRDALARLLGALRAAQALCGEDGEAAAHAALLAGPPLLLPEAATAAALRGERGERPRFGAAWTETPPRDAVWYAAQFWRWGWIEGSASDPHRLAGLIFDRDPGVMRRGKAALPKSSPYSA